MQAHDAGGCVATEGSSITAVLSPIDVDPDLDPHDAGIRSTFRPEPTYTPLLEPVLVCLTTKALPGVTKRSFTSTIADFAVLGNPPKQTPWTEAA
ncbi:MAG TPA: hypothetical protein VNA87_05295 [Actinomycetota bacterium]|nr:hypothetical protein [Actinomycetota bacterium]